MIQKAIRSMVRDSAPPLLAGVTCNPTPAFWEQESTMTVYLDHLMIPSRNKVASAKLLAELLGVPWSATGVGPFAPVYVNDGWTIDFDEWTEPFPMIHYCFRVGQDDFNASLGESKRLEYRTVATFMGQSPNE